MDPVQVVAPDDLLRDRLQLVGVRPVDLDQRLRNGAQLLAPGDAHSSLGYLRRFPFDKLKIDKMFVEDLSERSQAFSIIKTIVALGRSLDQAVVAEGIETLEQARIIQPAGCHLGQGFYMARPLALGALLRLVEERNPAPPAALSA